MTAPTIVTVMSANLWHDWPRQHRWSQRLDAAAQLAEDVQADVICLQEASRTRSLRADEWLADRLGMERAYVRANGSLRGIGFEEGLAVLSRFPMDQVRHQRLSRNPWIRRMAIAARLATPAGPIHAVSVHLGLVPRHNVRHLRILREWVSSIADGGVAVIGGDCNAPPSRAEIGHLRTDWVDAFHHARGHDESSTHRRLRRGHDREQLINYVFVQQSTDGPWRIVEAEHVDGPGGLHSDHRAVIARIIGEPVVSEHGELGEA